MCEIPEADTLEEFLSILSTTKARTVTNLILSHGDNLSAVEPNAKNASGVTAQKITNERPCLPVPYLHDGVIATTDDPFFVHAHTPHKPGVGIGVTLKAKHPSLARDGAVSTGAQNDSATTGVTHARDRRRHVLLVDARHESQVRFGGGGFIGRRYGIQFFARRPAFAGVNVNQSDVLVG
jgi:hypothetical protein